eukprot:TRINITY_DN9723_c0_g1_i2.p1 TRINITY_DN9723_c0_g1~~TRINITY_DN9723_c0_g1_i2.p1  ORF type:complete len:836 (+),score=247.31 TRINITY_DN9723_c0_g1_i2:47-2509(+)
MAANAETTDIDELRIDNDRLQKENKNLIAANQMLREKLQSIGILLSGWKDNDPAVIVTTKDKLLKIVQPIMQQSSNIDDATRERRKRIVTEMVETERLYIKRLSQCINFYYHPLVKEQRIPLKTLSEIFCNIEEVLEVNLKILKSMEVRYESWDDNQKVGDLFEEVEVPIKDAYGKYGQTYSNAIIVLRDLQLKNASFAQFLEETRMMPEVDAQGLGSLLIMPIQRIPRYKLLLKELQTNTHQLHPDSMLLERALDIVKNMANHINKSIREAENRQKLIDIQASFSDTGGFNITDPRRIFVKDGPLLKVCRKALKLRHFFLFSDVLIYADTSSSSTSFVFHQAIQLDACKVDDVIDENKRGYPFRIISSAKSFQVIANTIEEKKSWMEILDITIKEYTSKILSVKASANISVSEAALAPVWVSDKDSPYCLSCNAPFTVIRRRHHCRRCGLLVCGDCSDMKIVLPNLGDKKLSRVCDNCFIELSADEDAKSRLAEKRIFTERRNTKRLLKRSGSRSAGTSVASFRSTESTDSVISGVSLNSSLILDYADLNALEKSASSDSVEKVAPASPTVPTRSQNGPKPLPRLPQGANENGINSEKNRKKYLEQEMVHSEKEFVSSLRQICDVFLSGCQAVASLTQADMSVIFNNIETLTTVHSEMLSDMEKQISTENSPISSFLLMKTYLQNYHMKYCSNIPAALAKLEEWSGKPSFMHFLEKCRASVDVPLKELLQRPLQRLKAYPRYLERLMPLSQGEDLEILKDVHETIDKLIAYIDEQQIQVGRGIWTTPKLPTVHKPRPLPKPKPRSNSVAQVEEQEKQNQ